MSTTSITCPNCGAPSQVPLGQTSIVCTFCHHPFQIAAPAPPPPPPPQWAPQQIPSIVIVPPGELYGSPMMNTTVGSVAAFTGMRVLFAIIPVLVFAGIGGATWFSRAGMGGFGGLGASWNGGSPLLCGGNDTVNASDITASFSSGSTIIAGGNCHFKCTRCTLRAPVAVSAGGNAQIDLIDSRVEGSQQAIMAGGNAQIRMLGSSTLVGEVSKGGNAEVTVPPGARPAPGPPTPAVPAAPRSNPSPAAPTPGPSRRH